MNKISDLEIINYWKKLDRGAFMGENRDCADVDAAFPIGHGQTISQPSLVLKMTTMLEMQPGSKILEIGTGSGYQTALLAQFADKIYTVERIDKLMVSAKQRLHKMGFENIKFKLGDGSQGWAEHSPFDRIMVTAGAHTIPPELVKQLSFNGRMVIPVGRWPQRLTVVEKNEKGDISIEKGIPVAFVKLIGDY